MLNRIGTGDHFLVRGKERGGKSRQDSVSGKTFFSLVVVNQGGNIVRHVREMLIVNEGDKKERVIDPPS